MALGDVDTYGYMLIGESDNIEMYLSPNKRMIDMFALPSYVIETSFKRKDLLKAIKYLKENSTHDIRFHHSISKAPPKRSLVARFASVHSPAYATGLLKRTSGLKRLGSVKASYGDLLDHFGAPVLFEDEGDRRVSWVITFGDIVVTIYDSKKLGKSVSDVKNWDVASTSPVALKLIQSILQIK